MGDGIGFPGVSRIRFDRENGFVFLFAKNGKTMEATPTCPPPTKYEIDCSSQLFPEPPKLRRTDTGSNYAVPRRHSSLDAGYERWLLEDNFARLSRLEMESLKIQKELEELSRLMKSRLIPPPPSSPVKRQIADASSPYFPFSSATKEMMENFGM